jgi:hypothetical protein
MRKLSRDVGRDAGPWLCRDRSALLRDMMIVQLTLAGIGQHQIRQIVGVDIHRVSRIGKLMKKPKETK